MKTYATLVKFTPQGIKHINNMQRAVAEETLAARKMGVKPIGSYATLGPYDLMLLYEAPDEQAATAMSLSFATKWSGTTESWTLIPMEQFSEIAKAFKG